MTHVPEAVHALDRTLREIFHVARDRHISTSAAADAFADKLTGGDGLDWYLLNSAGAGTRDKMVGRLTAIKNQALALRAFATLARDGLHSPLLVLVGGGEDESSLRALARALGIADRVRFAGWWTGDNLPAVYHGSEIIALSSRNEGTLVCLLEAVACGRAVVATDVGGVADVLEDGRLGVMVPPESVAHFAAALRRVLNPVERERFERADRSSLIARYGLERMVADVSALYDALISQNSADGTTNMIHSVHSVLSGWNSPDNANAPSRKMAL